MKESSVITKEASVTTKNISKVFLLRVLAQYPFLVLFVMLIPRMMGPEIYGEYALLISIVAIMTSLTNLGVMEICGRFVPEFEVRGESADIKRFSSNLLTLKIVIDLITSIILLSVLHLAYDDQFPFTYFIIVVAIPLVSDLGTVPYALLFGLNKLGKFSLRDPVNSALILISIFILFHYYGLFGAILSTLLVEGFVAMLYFFWTRKYFRTEDFRVDLSFLKPYLRFGFMFYMSWGLLNICQSLGNPLIGYITKDLQEVALFDIPNQIFLVMANFTLFIMISLVPIFTRLLLTGKEETLINWSRLIIKYIGIRCTIIFWAFILAGRDLIPIVIGSNYRGIFPNGVVLLSGMFPIIFAQLGFVFSVVYKEPEKYFQALCFAFVAFLVGSILFIPRYASMGCAIATLISCIVLAVVICVYFREKLFPCLAYGFKVIALGVIFVPFLFVRGNLITNLLLTVCSVLTYILLLFVSRVLSLREIKGIFQAIRHQPEEL